MYNIQNFGAPIRFRMKSCFFGQMRLQIFVFTYKQLLFVHKITCPRALQIHILKNSVSSDNISLKIPFHLITLKI